MFAAKAKISRWGLLAVVAAVVALGSGHDRGQDALAAGLSAQFSIAAYQGGVQLKDECDSEIGPDFKCLVHPGGTFQLEVYLDKLPPGLPDGQDPDAVGGYQAIGVRLDHSQNLSFISGSEAWSWPGCVDAFDDSPDVGLVNLTCLNAPGANGSTYSSTLVPVLTMDFMCPPFKSVETITIIFGTDGDKLNALDLPYDTVVVDENGGKHTQNDPAETLIINCDNFFPWDINGDNAVSSLDIFQVLGQFGQTKPTP